MRPSPVERTVRSTWPTGHVGWTFNGRAQFEGRIGTYLAEGAARHERVMLVTEEPNPDLWPKTLRDEGILLLLSTAELYGTSGVLDPATQRTTFEEALAEARRCGFAGLRVAANNTMLVTTPERLAAWRGWEQEAESMMQLLPISGLCGFDRSRLCDRDVAALRREHRVEVHGPARPS